MEYIDYDYYRTKGRVAPETDFERVKLRAFGIIDNATQNRLASAEVISENVKGLCCDLIDYLINNCFAQENGIQSKSQSVGNVSESESYIVRTSNEQRTEIDNMVYDYLATETTASGVPLLYKGANNDSLV